MSTRTDHSSSAHVLSIGLTGGRLRCCRRSSCGCRPLARRASRRRLRSRRCDAITKRRLLCCAFALPIAAGLHLRLHATRHQPREPDTRVVLSRCSRGRLASGTSCCHGWWDRSPGVGTTQHGCRRHRRVLLDDRSERRRRRRTRSVVVTRGGIAVHRRGHVQRNGECRRDGRCRFRSSRVTRCLGDP